MTLSADPWSIFNGTPWTTAEPATERLATAYRAEARRLADPDLFIHDLTSAAAIDRADVLRRLAGLHHAAVRLATTLTNGPEAIDELGRPARPDPMVELGLLWELVEPLGVTPEEACRIVAKET